MHLDSAIDVTAVQMRPNSLRRQAIVPPGRAPHHLPAHSPMVMPNQIRQDEVLYE